MKYKNTTKINETDDLQKEGHNDRNDFVSLNGPELCRPGVVLNLPVVCRQPSYRFVCPEKTETHNMACLWLPPKRHLSTCC